MVKEKVTSRLVLGVGLVTLLVLIVRIIVAITTSLLSPAPEAQQTGAPTSDEHRRYRVSVTDDDKMLNRTIARIVQSALDNNVDVFTYTNGESLLTAIGAQPIGSFDLHITDNNMEPAGGILKGIDLIIPLKEHDPQAQVIVFTADEVQITVEALGGLYLSKGTRATALANLIRVSVGLPPRP